MCGIDGIRKGNYFGGEPIGSSEVELRVGKLKNGKTASRDEITGEMIKGGGDRVVFVVLIRQRNCVSTISRCYLMGRIFVS